MKLVSIQKMLEDAQKHRYAIGGFNIINMETLQAVVSAATLEKSPVIIQIRHGNLEHAGATYVYALANVAANISPFPIALQLDHGQSFDQVMSCIDCGFSSVMIDVSAVDFYENVTQTKRVVKEAHARGVTVEAELGKIFGGNDPIDLQTSALTDQKLAALFVKETGIDALAVSIGTAHGFYAVKPKIHFDLLEELVQMVSVPLVIHGGSDIPEEDIIRMIRMGVSKINIGTELMSKFSESLKENLLKNPELPLRTILTEARFGVEELVRKKIRLLNSQKICGSPTTDN